MTFTTNPKPPLLHPPQMKPKTRRCPDCNGKGSDKNDVGCSTCRGDGEVLAVRVFECTLIAYATVLVEAKDVDEANDRLREEGHAPMGWEMDEWSIDRELKTANDLATAKRHNYENIEDL